MKFMGKACLLAACILTMLGSGNVSAGSAISSIKTVEQVPVYRQVEQDMLITVGKIIEVNDKQLVIKGEGSQPLIAVNIGEDTYLLNGKNGKTKDLSSFKVGKQVTAYYTSRMTRSLPPQAQALALVLGGNEEGYGKFFKVDKVSLSEDGKYINVMSSNHDIIATVDKKACKNYADIKEGDKLLVWYSIMTMSLPARTNAEKAVILPELN